MRIREALLAGPLGFGTAPLGNMYRDIPEDEAPATVDAALDAGTRFFDTAPFYGAGLAKIRLGQALSKRPRDDYVLSTKVGRLNLDEIEDPGGRDHGDKGDIKAAALHFSLAHPASAAAIPGASKPERILEDYAALKTIIPADF
jgi:D-threo-aldose 1-dehydrogenase